MGFQCNNQVTQTLTIAELSEHESEQLIPTGEVLHITVYRVLTSQIIEMIPVEECN